MIESIRFCEDYITFIMSERFCIIVIFSTQEWLTAEKCGNHLLQRGLVRIKSVMEAEQVVNYLTIKGYINYGLVPRPQSLVLTSPNKVIPYTEYFKYSVHYDDFKCVKSDTKQEPFVLIILYWNMLTGACDSNRCWSGRIKCSSSS